MNRKQRRAAMKKDKQAIVRSVDMQQKRNAKYVKEQMELVKTTAMNEMLDYCTEGYLTVFAITLQDELGLCEDTIKRTLDRVEEKFSNVLSGHVSLQDMKDAVEDELNIVITAKKGGKNE